MSTADEDLVAFAKARIGTVLRGKYRLDDVVGYGGMAVVFRATHRNQAELAVKVLHPKLARVNGVRDRFLREGYAANSVKHKGAVLVLDDDVDEDGSTFLVMELLDGQSCELIWQRRGGTFPLKSALTVAIEALDVLASAHSRGIVHRDIKPANLFVTKEGAVKVLDFGIAKVLDAVSAQSTGRLPIGTPAFMSPEQALGESNDVGPKTDLWAMGATLFSLLSGELVFDAPTAHEILVKTATTKPRSLGSVVPFLAKEVIELVDRALQVDISARWASAGEMRDVAARVHKQIFRDAPSVEGLLELYGGDDIDTANANDNTVRELEPPRMSTPPPANHTLRPPSSKRSSGRIRISPWTDERKTSPRLSLVLDDSSVAASAPPPPHPVATPRANVIPPPTSSRPGTGHAATSSQRVPIPDDSRRVANKTVRLPNTSTPSLPGVAPGFNGSPGFPGAPGMASSPGVPSSSPGLPSSGAMPISSGMPQNLPTASAAWRDQETMRYQRRKTSPATVIAIVVAVLLVLLAGIGGWLLTSRSAPAQPAPRSTAR